MDNRSQFYIISAVMICAGLLIISSYLILDIKHVHGVSFEADNIQRLYEEVIAVSITQDPALKAHTLIDNFNKTENLIDCMFHSRGYDVRTDCNMSDPCGLTSMFIHAEVKNITMHVNCSANSSDVIIENSGFGGDFIYNLSTGDDNSSGTINENDFCIISSLNPNATAKLMDSYNNTVLRMQLGNSTSKSSTYIKINGTILNPAPSLKITYYNGTLPVNLSGGLGFPGTSSVVLDVNQSSQLINFSEINNNTPIIWITDQTDLDSGRITAVNAINISMVAPVPISTDATGCLASISLYMSSYDTSVNKKFNITKEYFN